MMNKKRGKKKKQINLSKQHDSVAKTHNYTDAFLTTLFIIGGIYASFFVLLFFKDGNAIDELLQAQSSLGGLYVNLFAVIGVAYSKFAKETFLHRNVYWLSLGAFVTIISIFAQARIMLEVHSTVIFAWLETRCASFALQTVLAVLIFAIAAQKDLNIRITYKKKK